MDIIDIMLTSKKIQLILLPFIFIFFVLSPLFELKLLLFLALVVLIINNISTIKKAETWALLAIVFAFSFINTPYWQVFQDPKPEIIALLLLIFAGGIWSYFSSSDVTLKKISLPVIPLAVLTALVLVVNYKPLLADIAWRGDESYHIYMLLHLINYTRGIHSLDPILYLVLTIIVVALFLMIRAKKIKNTKVVRILSTCFGGLILLFPAILFYKNLPVGWSPDALNLYNMTRWPFFEKWISLFFLFPNFGYDIRLYRIVPLLCTLLIAWYLYIKFDNKFNNHVVSVLFSLTFITIPLVYYFSTILYLEMPVVLLMTYCVFNIRDLLFTDSKTLVNKPVWYALLLLAFLKETVLIALLVLLISRFIVQMASHKVTLKLMLSELKACGLVIFPVLAFLFFRNFFTDPRPYTPRIGILLDPSNYWIVVKALFDQTGVLFPLAVAGLIVLFLKKERGVFFVLLILCIGTVIFFMIDSQLYVGYARYNLFVVPAVFYLSYRFLTPAPKPLLVICFIALLAGNYFLNPIMPDGTRISNWGCPGTDGAEYYYPYEPAIRYLQSEKNIKSVLILGQYFPYWGIQFYQAKYNFYPMILIHQFNGPQPEGVVWFDGRRFNAAAERYYLSEFFSGCINPGSETAAVDAIIYHSVNNVDLNMNDTYCGKYRITKRLSNSLNSLYIFELLH